MKVWLNGQLVDDEAACVSPADHGLLVGDGVFETLRCYAGVPFALEDHLERLEEGAKALLLEPPARVRLVEAAHAVIEANALGDARMRITLTSGAGPPGLLRGGGEPTVLVTAQPLAPWPPTASAIVSNVRRDQDSPLAGVKTISLVESVMALSEARARGAAEAILLNRRGDVCEATTANVFCVRDGRVATPLCLLGLPGRDHAWLRARALRGPGRWRHSRRSFPRQRCSRPMSSSSPRRRARSNPWWSSTGAPWAWVRRARSRPAWRMPTARWC